MSKKVSPEEFVRAWQASESVGEVCERLGMTLASAYKRRHEYRKIGVRLKTMKGGPKRLDVDALNKLCGERS